MWGFLQQEEGLSGEERQDGGRVLLQSLGQLLAAPHQAPGALRPGHRFHGPRLLVLGPAHHHHGLHIHPLQEGESEGQALDHFPAVEH